MIKEWKDMNKEERALHLFDKMKSSINETFELIGLNADIKKATLYTKVILKSNTKIDLDKMQDYVISKYKGFGYPSVKLFLDSLGIISESDKLATQAENAWNSVLSRLAYMKESTSYEFEDPFTGYAISKITISRIMQAQECVSSRANKINSFQSNQIRKDFLRFYDEAVKNGGSVKEIAGTGCNVSVINSEASQNVLLKAPKCPQLNEFNKNVNDIAVEVFKKMEEGK